MKTLFSIILLAFLAYGCDKCANIMCECITPAIQLRYENDSTSCQDFQHLVELRTYNEVDDRLVEYASVDAWGCTLALPLVEPGRYWVITSDSLNISDTVRVNKLSFEELEKDDCCNCPDPVEEIEVRVNDEVYSGDEIEVVF